MKYAWIIVILALAGGGWWWRTRSTGARTGAAVAAGGKPAAGASPATRAGGGVTPTEVRAQRPLGSGLPSPTADLPDPSGLATAPPFDRETRDPAWADEQEHELRLRLAEVERKLKTRGAAVEVTGAECRATACRVELAAPASRDLSAFYGAIETPEGLSGWADGVVLGEVVTDPSTGAVTTQVTVAFDRTP